jgi:hypothetical protein
VRRTECEQKASVSSVPMRRARAREVADQVSMKAEGRMERVGMSDIEGKAARVAASEWSRWAASDIDGKTERSNRREPMSQCGQRASFN